MPRKIRTLSHSRTVRLLERGAMITVQDEIVLVFRSRDERRRAVGQLEQNCLQALIERGVLSSGDGSPRTYFMNEKKFGNIEYDCDRGRNDIETRSKYSHAPSSRIEALIAFEKNDANRGRLVKAALRLCHLSEATRQSGRVTMNWDFVPRVSGRRISGSTGVNFSGGWAREQLRHVNSQLGSDAFNILMQILVLEKSKKQVQSEAGVSRRILDRRFQNALHDLAQIFDNVVSAEFRGE